MLTMLCHVINPTIMMGTLPLTITILTFIGEALAKVAPIQLSPHLEFGLAITPHRHSR